jgi:hypothetical protein
MHEGISPARSLLGGWVVRWLAPVVRLSNHVTTQLPNHPTSRGLARFLFWSLVFGVAYTQPRLYYSNQNQYFLHGLATAGLGFLKDDWLARTADPTPIFSAIVALTYRYLHESLF